MGNNNKKVAVRLVEKHRQEKWWDDECIAPVPTYVEPVVNNKTLQ
jgi:hypothetical protein